MKKLFIVFLILFIAGLLVYGFSDHNDQPVKKQIISRVETPKPKSIPLPTEDEVEKGINDYRISNSLASLSDDPTLDIAAQARAESMCTDNNWSHNGAWAILDQYYIYAAAGENIYFGPLQDNQATSAVDRWVKSPTHLENIVGNYTQVGTGIKSCPGYQNDPTAVIITNYFGIPE